MTISFDKIYRTGGGRIAYVWNVSGFPWAVCDQPALVTALNNSAGQAGTAAYTVRSKIFGPKLFYGAGGGVGNTVFPYKTAPIFACLRRDGISLPRWQLDEAQGLVKGGGWSVELDNIVTGEAWYHKQSGDEIWGLEGVHRVPSLYESDSIAWGYLASDFLIETGGSPTTSITVTDEVDDRLIDAIDAMSGEEYLPLWVDKECIAVTGRSGLDLTIATTATVPRGRGLYRSREANHLYRPNIHIEPIVSTVPGSIADGYCWLWAIPMTHDGQLIFDPADGTTVLCSLWDAGVVTPNIKIDKHSKTSVQVLSVENSLKLDVNAVEFVADYETHLTGFSLCRPAGSGTSASSIVKYRQSPHLIIRELDYYNVTYRPGFTSGDAVGYTLKYHSIPIWLCAPGERVYFKTISELINAINLELRYLSEGSPNQKSGSADSGDFARVYTKRPYTIDDINHVGGGWHFRRQQYETVDGTYEPAFVSGPLAWLLGLGYPADVAGDGSTLPYEDAAIWKSIKDRDYAYAMYHMEWVGNKMHAGFEDMRHWQVVDDYYTNYGDTIDFQHYSKDYESFVSTFTESPGLGVPKRTPLFYHQWDWVGHHPGTFDELYNSSSPPSDFWNHSKIRQWYIPDISTGHPTDTQEEHRLWLVNRDDNDIYAFATDEEINIGAKSLWAPTFTATIDTFSSVAWNDNLSLEVDNDYLSLEDEEDSIIYGHSLFYLPFLEKENIDTCGITKNITTRSDKVSEIFKAILGHDGAPVTLPPEVSLTHCPFWITDASQGFFSLIDYNSMDYELKPYNAQTYSYEISQNKTIYDLLKSELLFHGTTMTREWDYTNLAWIFRFRQIAGSNLTEAWMSGREIDASINARDSVPTVWQNSVQVCNQLDVQAKSLLFKYKPEDKSKVIFHMVGDKTNAVRSEFKKLAITPELSRLTFAAVERGSEFWQMMYSDLDERLSDMLRHLSRPRYSQTRTIAINGMFRALLGKESLLTDVTARNPFTGQIGLEEKGVLITGWQHDLDIDSESIKIEYIVTTGEGVQLWGIAPAMLLESGNFTIDTVHATTGTWSGEPNDHEYTNSNQAKDGAFFDCFNLQNPALPVVRNCSCNNYKVIVLESGTYGWTPLRFNVDIDIDGSGNISAEFSSGDTTGMSESKDYIVYFDSYDNCEDCQKRYIFFADEKGTIGASKISARRWG